MSIVELDGGDAAKILDDLREANAVVSEVANGGGPSMDYAYELAKRLDNATDLLSRAMLLEKMGD